MTFKISISTTGSALSPSLCMIPNWGGPDDMLKSRPTVQRDLETGWSNGLMTFNDRCKVLHQGSNNPARIQAGNDWLREQLC